MLSSGTLYTTAALLALVAAACSGLCLVWSVPAWRRRLAPDAGVGGLRGWQARAGGGLVSAGIGAAALVAWYGLYWTLAGV